MNCPSDGSGNGYPVLDLDPFSTEFLSNPYRFHPRLRDAGPVVRLRRYGIWAMARHREVKSALEDWRTFCSSRGGGLSDFRKEKPWRPPSIILEADPPLHTRTPWCAGKGAFASCPGEASRDVYPEGGTVGRRSGCAGAFRCREGSGRSVPVERLSRCRRCGRGRPGKPAALRRHGVQCVRPPQRTVRRIVRECQASDRLDHGTVPSRSAERGRLWREGLR